MARSPVQKPDDKARALVRALLRDARYAALAVRDPADGSPGISRIALAMAHDGMPMSLISDLSAHAKALGNFAECALLIGEPGEKGDPLTHPRLSLKACARFVRHGEKEHGSLAAEYLVQRPKSKLYIGFGDFSLVLFKPISGLLNGGFGKAFVFSPEDF